MKMKKTYISPVLNVFITECEGLLATSDVRIETDNNSGHAGGGMMTNKKEQTDMWGNDPDKGIWQ